VQREHLLIGSVNSTHDVAVGPRYEFKHCLIILPEDGRVTVQYVAECS